MDSRALIVVLAVAACAGPSPRAEVVSVAPSPVPGHQRVTLDVRNAGRGHGDVELDVTLTSVGGRRVREVKTLTLKKHEHIELTVDIAAPADTYVATVEALYPD